MNMPIAMPDDPSRRDLVHLQDINQTYDGGKTWVIKDLNLRIEAPPESGRGRAIVILGPSGCGKSTLFRYIGGLQEPTSGTVWVNEKKLTGHENVGMVFQEYSPFDWLTSAENVMLPLQMKWERSGSILHRLVKPFRLFEKHRLKKEWRAKAVAMLRDLGLEGKEDLYAGKALSGGQRQRLAVARSLILDQEVLMMDEPFGALDPKLRVNSQLILERVWEERGFTLILVTHDVFEAVFLADTIYFMSANPGQIIEEVDVSSVLPFHRDAGTMLSSEFMALAARLHQKIMHENVMAGKPATA